MVDRSSIRPGTANASIVLLAVLLAACEQEGATNGAVTPEPDLRLVVTLDSGFGGFDEASDHYLVSRALQAAWHADGELLLIDQRAPAAWLLDSTGRHIRKLGQGGDGPGEYRSPRYGGFLGDSAVWISDSGLRRITLWDRAEGTLLSTRQIALERLPDSEVRVEGRWLMESGAQLGVPVVDAPLGPGVVTQDWPVPIWSDPNKDAAVRLDLSPVPLQARMVYGDEDQRLNMVVLEAVFEGTPLQGTFDGGARFFVVDRSEAAEDPAAGLSIWISNSTADSIERIGIPVQPPSVSGPWREWIEAEARILADRIPRNPTFGAATEERILEATWIPNHMPPIRGAFFDVEGIWLETVPVEPSAATVLWERYDPEGVKLGEVELPSRFRGLAGRTDAIVGVVMDSLQVPRLERYHVSGYEAQAVNPPDAEARIEPFDLGRSDLGIGDLLALPSGSVIAAIPRGAEIRILNPESGEVTVREADLAEGRSFPRRLYWNDGTIRALDLGPGWLATVDPDRTPNSVEDDERLQVAELRDGSARYNGVLGFARDDRLIILASAELFGAALASTDVDPALIPSSPVHAEPVWIHDRAGGGLDTLAVISTLHKYFLLTVADPVGPDGSTRRRSTPIPQPFADSPLVAWDPDSENVVVLERRISDDLGPTPTYAVYRVDLEGDTVSVDRHRYEPIPMQSDWFDAAAREAGAQFEDLAEEGYRFALDHLFRPVWLPPVSVLVAGADGTLWIGREAIPEATHRRWDVVNRDGERTHHFTLPVALEVSTALGRQAWAIERGADTPGRIWRIFLDSDP